jgi:nucleoside-diphosphate-sugar epimerase
MKTILICGATGFIGRNLTEYFSKKEGYKVRAVYHDRPPIKEIDVEWIHADLNNKEDVKRVINGCNIVLQYAATTSGAGDIVIRPYIHVTDNAVMNSLILRECFESQVEHFVFPSCTVMYQPSEKAVSESDFDANKQLLPNYFGVGNTKLYIEKQCEFYSRLGKTKFTVLRQSNIYGPHDKYDLKRSHVFGATVTKIMTNTSGELEIWGSGEERRDLIHVNDLVEAVNLSLENQKEKFSLYNIGLGSDISINELVQKMIQISGKKITVSHDLSKPTIKTSLFLDYNKATSEIGWSPRTDLNSGIEKTLKWFKENINV